MKRKLLTGLAAAVLAGGVASGCYYPASLTRPAPILPAKREDFPIYAKKIPAPSTRPVIRPYEENVPYILSVNNGSLKK